MWNLRSGPITWAELVCGAAPRSAPGWRPRTCQGAPRRSAEEGAMLAQLLPYCWLIASCQCEICFTWQDAGFRLTERGRQEKMPMHKTLRLNNGPHLGAGSTGPPDAGASRKHPRMKISWAAELLLKVKQWLTKDFILPQTLPLINAKFTKLELNFQISIQNVYSEFLIFLHNLYQCQKWSKAKKKSKKSYTSPWKTVLSPCSFTITVFLILLLGAYHKLKFSYVFICIFVASVSRT